MRQFTGRSGLFSGAWFLVAAATVACGTAAPGPGEGTGGSNSGGGGSATSGGHNGTSGGAVGVSGGASSASGGAGAGPATGGGGANSSGGSAGGPTGGSVNGGSGGSSGGGSGGGGSGGGPLGSGLTDVSQFTPASACSVVPDVKAASIGMVGIATFTTDLAGAERAIIQFGKTAEYTLEAPVDFAAEGHRTLMLGMTANTEWHYRVVAIAGNTACIGEDKVFKTGALPTGANGNITPMKGDSTTAPAKGFRVVAAGNYVTIWNEAGEVVWAYNFGGMIVSANMSWDGKQMYARDTGPFDAGSGGNIYRVSMEGGTKTTMQLTGGSHHDVVAIPTGFAYIAKKNKGECDHIFTAGPNGEDPASLVDLDPYVAPFPAAMASEKCHVNAINYYHSDTKPFFSVSDREKDVVLKVDAKTGELLASIGKAPQGTAPNHVLAEGGGTTWRVQHGHHWFADDKFIVFSNGSFGGGTSKAILYTIAGSNGSIEWQYATGSAPTLSNALHMPSGNFLVYAGQAGQLVELDSSGKAIQTMKTPSNGGYARYRETLYGPPMQY